MSYLLGFVGLILIGSVIGLVMSRVRRQHETEELLPARQDSEDPDAAPLVREAPPQEERGHVFGTAEQRVQALWACVGMCGAAVMLVATGADVVGQLMLFLGLIMAVHIAVLGAVASLRREA